MINLLIPPPPYRNINIYIYLHFYCLEREIDGIALKYALDYLSISFDQPIIYDQDFF